jgi:hypothetical protein
MNDQAGPNISAAQQILGNMLARVTALYDTINDDTLPPRLRQVQIGNLGEDLEQLKKVMKYE